MSDFAGLLRGKAVPASAFESRRVSGIRWTPTNIQITCFDTIAETPCGAFGDVILRGDPSTRALSRLPDLETLDFALGDISDLEWARWECCARSILRTAAERLRAETGLEPRARFGHDFMFLTPGNTRAFSIAGQVERLGFMWALTNALEGTGIAPDSFLREYVPCQTRWQVARGVTLPARWPGIFSGALSAFLLSLSNLPLSVYTSGADTPLPVCLFSRTANNYSPLVPTIAMIGTFVSGFIVLTLVVLRRVLSPGYPAGDQLTTRTRTSRTARHSGRGLPHGGAPPRQAPTARRRVP